MFFDYKGHKIYYEIHGEGKPIMILNGIMMSTKSWVEFIEPLTANNKLIFIDFLNQGQSDKVDYQFYHDTQVDILGEFMKIIKPEKLTLYGISYGGEIAMQFTLKYPEYVDRLFLSNTCPNTSYWLEEVGNAWNQASVDPLTYYLVTIPFIYSPKFFIEKKEWMENRKKILLEVFADKNFIDSMKILTNSSVGYDIRDKLDQIKCPTMILGCEYDFVTPFYQQEEIHSKIKKSELLFIHNSGHGIMYEKPNIFVSTLLGFANNDKQEYNL